MVIKHKEWVGDVTRVRGDTENRHGLLRLEKNERVTGFSEDFWSKALGQLTQEYVLAYPEPERFYASLAGFLGLPVDHLVLTAGSDAAIRMGFDLCVKLGDAVVSIEPTFAMVQVYCELYGAEKRFTAFEKDLTLDIDGLVRSIDEKVSLIVLANPNSPTGTYIKPPDMVRIVDRAKECRATVLIDEAYHGFCSETNISMVDKYENVMVTRSFSKAPGLAGLRIGYIVACPELAALLYKFRPMYEVNSMSLLFADQLLQGWSEVDSYIASTADGEKFLKKELERLGFPYVETYTNFIHVDFKDKKEEALNLFEKVGMKVGRGLPIGGYEDYLRITLGPRSVMERFIELLEAL